MRKFNLTKALKGEKIVTSKGNPAKLIYVSPDKKNDFPVLCIVIEDKTKIERPEWFNKEGHSMWNPYVLEMDETLDKIHGYNITAINRHFHTILDIPGVIQTEQKFEKVPEDKANELAKYLVNNFYVVNMDETTWEE